MTADFPPMFPRVAVALPVQHGLDKCSRCHIWHCPVCGCRNPVPVTSR